MFENYPDVLNPLDISHCLNISLKTVYKLIHNNELPYKRIGSHYKIQKQAVIDYLNMR